MADTTATITPSDNGAQAAPEDNTPETPATEVSTPVDSGQEDTSDTDQAKDSTETQDTHQDAKDSDSQDGAQDSTETDTASGAQEDPQDGSDNQDDDADDSDDNDLDPKVRRMLSKARREASNLRDRAKTAETEVMRLKVAMSSGIPEDAMEFLHGDTQEALEQSAEKLLVMMGYHGRVTPPGGPVETGGNPRRGNFTPVDQARQTADLDTIGSRIYER